MPFIRTTGGGGGGGGGGNAFTVIECDAGTNPVATGSSDTLTLTGTQITTTGNSTTDTVTFSIAAGAITNTEVNASAAIAVSKLAALTASRAVVSDGSGFISAATTTSTEIGYVNGVTSAIQTQLNAKAPTASPAFTTQVTFGNYHLEPSEVDDGNSSTADTIDWSAGSAHKSTLTGNCTYTFSNPVTGGAYVLRVLTGAGSFTVTWPAAVKWAGGVAPTITTTASRMDLFNFYYDGTNYYGSYVQNYTP